jgi:hypothetical protein
MAMIDLRDDLTMVTRDGDEFRSFLKEQDKLKKSRIVEFKNWQMTDEGLALKGKKLNKFKVYPMRDSGMVSTLKLFGMPRRFYYEKAPTDMLVRDINRMKEEFTEDSEIMCHMQKNDDGKYEMRAVTKPTTRRVKKTVDVIDSTIMNNQFLSGYYSEYGIRMTTTSNDKPIKVTKNDIINVGTDMAYSDIGWHMTNGSPHLFRLVCENGMIVKEKSSFLKAFRIQFGLNMDEQQFLKVLYEHMSKIEIDGKMLQETFKAMKDHQVRELPYHQSIMSNVKSLVTPEIFTNDEKLSVKVMDSNSGKEKIFPNLDLKVYSLVDKMTRLAKAQDQVGRMQLESLAGKVTVQSHNAFLQKAA